MRKTFWYILGGQLATISIPALAQDAMPQPMPEGVGHGDMTHEQMATHDAWPPERQAAYGAWPSEAQAYFWTLTPERQEIFWMLRDEDKLAITAMDEATREAAWVDIERRLDMMSTPAPPEGAAPEDATPEEEAMPEESSPEEPGMDEPTEPEGR